MMKKWKNFSTFYHGCNLIPIYNFKMCYEFPYEFSSTSPFLLTNNHTYWHTHNKKTCHECNKVLAWMIEMKEKRKSLAELFLPYIICGEKDMRCTQELTITSIISASLSSDMCFRIASIKILYFVKRCIGRTKISASRSLEIVKRQKQ